MNREELVSAFASVTGASDTDAKKYLETHNWDIDLATALYLEQQEQFEDETRAPQAQHHAPAPTPSAPSRPAPLASSNSYSKAKPAPRRGGMRTLADLGGGDDSDDDHDHDDDDDDHENYYAGGERSGQMIQAPKKPAANSKDVVQGVFDAAKAHGGRPADEGAHAPPSHFTGTGYTLGDTVTHSHEVKGREAEKKKQSRVITFWRNGFTVDDGPLRSFEDPANRAFLMSINKGEVPDELRQQAIESGGELGVQIKDSRNEEFKEPPKPRVVAFAGAGHTLGGPSLSPTPSPASAPAPASGPIRSLQIDESKPTTSLQLRLADGTRLVAKFNHTHTIQDIRNFVDSARRGGQAYDLMTAFPPPKVLADPNQTITDAGLLNSVVVQKMK